MARRKAEEIVEVGNGTSKTKKENEEASGTAKPNKQIETTTSREVNINRGDRQQPGEHQKLNQWTAKRRKEVQETDNNTAKTRDQSRRSETTR